jgi:hypothetical protein
MTDTTQLDASTLLGIGNTKDAFLDFINTAYNSQRLLNDKQKVAIDTLSAVYQNQAEIVRQAEAALAEYNKALDTQKQSIKSILIDFGAMADTSLADSSALLGISQTKDAYLEFLNTAYSGTTLLTDNQRAAIDSLSAAYKNLDAIIEEQRLALISQGNVLTQSLLTLGAIADTSKPQALAALGIEDSYASFLMFVDSTRNSTEILTDVQLAAINTLTAAYDGYNRAQLAALEEQRQAAIKLQQDWLNISNSFTQAANNINPIIKTFDEIRNMSLSLDNYNDIISSVGDTLSKQKEIAQNGADMRIAALEMQKDVFLSLQDLVQDLTQKITGFNSGTALFLDAEIAKARGAINNNQKADIVAVSSAANDYLEQVKSQSTSSLDYIREVAKTRQKVEALGTNIQGGTLESIENAINSEKTALESQLQTLNNTAIGILNRFSGTAQTAANNVAIPAAPIMPTAPIINPTENAILDVYRQYGQDTTGALEFWNAEFIGNRGNGLTTALNTIDLIMQNKGLSRVNGSHATGLDYVPFDGYVAELHKGERVQTAKEVQKDEIIKILIQNTKELKQEIKELKDLMKKMADFFGRADNNGSLSVTVENKVMVAA